MKENQISGWVSLVFARKQMFNPRPITKRDKKGKSIWLISIGFPASSEYYGWYINVDRSKVYPVRNSPKQDKIFYPKDTMIPIYKYVKGSGGKKGYREQKELSADIVIEEFNSWRE